MLHPSTNCHFTWESMSQNENTCCFQPIWVRENQTYSSKYPLTGFNNKFWPLRELLTNSKFKQNFFPNIYLPQLFIYKCKSSSQTQASIYISTGGLKGKKNHEFLQGKKHSMLSSSSTEHRYWGQKVPRKSGPELHWSHDSEWSVRGSAKSPATVPT